MANFDRSYRNLPKKYHLKNLKLEGGKPIQFFFAWYFWEKPIYGSWPPSWSRRFWLEFLVTSLHPKKWCFLNARRFCYAKITFFPDEMSWTGSGKKIKRKFMVLGPVLAFFPSQIKVTSTLICIEKIGQNWSPNHEFSLKIFFRTCTAHSVGGKMLFLHSKIFWRS